MAEESVHFALNGASQSWSDQSFYLFRVRIFWNEAIWIEKIANAAEHAQEWEWDSIADAKVILVQTVSRKCLTMNDSESTYKS